MSRHDALSVAILAGGRSRRMGRDKALMKIGDRTLLEIVAERASNVADELLVIASERPEYAALGYTVIPDRYPDAGSLGGIYTAISAAKHAYCLVLACDMPLLSRSLLIFMASLPREYDVLIPALPADRSDQGGRETLETLHAIYSRSCLAPIQSRLEAGHYKIVGFFDDVRVRRLDESTVRAIDPNLLSFFNANTPAEFAWVLDKIRAGSAGQPGE